METQKSHKLVKWFKQWRVKICYKKVLCHRQSNNKKKIQARRYYKFGAETIKSSLGDYSDEFISVTWNITVTANNNTDVAFKNCAPFSIFSIKINDVFVGEANHFHIAMPMYNLIEYSDNHSDTSGSLW